MADEVRRGLTARQKTLPPKYFYDARGSELFEQITKLPEYYQTRTELSILRTIADPLVDTSAFTELVEIGSGSATKTRALLDAMERSGRLGRYVPIDVSETALRDSSAALLERYTGLSIHGVVGDFLLHLSKAPTAIGPRLVIFLGSTIGNLHVDERLVFLRDVRALLGTGDAFLLGVDLVKDVAVIEAAYNDSQGVTAEFNRNILRVLNAALHADFAADVYQHRAFYNAEDQRIEMHPVPETRQQVLVADLDLVLSVEPTETIWTEISCKFTHESAAEMLSAAGLNLTEWHTDPENLFGLALASPR
ncbi:MAG: L-histidine N(alpha)-methyltransferase [Chloroflexi bacterium]|nr:L-histidine N(alpha)-methyltransferase [Chloroflexota bacterium]